MLTLCKYPIGTFTERLGSRKTRPSRQLHRAIEAARVRGSTSPLAGPVHHLTSPQARLRLAREGGSSYVRYAVFLTK